MRVTNFKAEFHFWRGVFACLFFLVPVLCVGILPLLISMVVGEGIAVSWSAGAAVFFILSIM